MPYRIIPYMPVEPENPEAFEEIQEAEEEKEHLETLHPENIYIIMDEDSLSKRENYL
ncbi:hypothetical protein GF336_05675 [Candidatus Woesearchaeota archaeon]|nr:hypothetical protein [Candidatus Woesearchaeota archaeon]